MLGTGGTAGLPDGWTHSLTGAPTVVYTKRASPLNASDGTLRIDYTGNAGSNAAILSTTLHSDLAAGSVVTVAGVVSFPADTTGLRLGFSLNLDSSGGSGETGKQVGVISYEQAEWRAGTYWLVSLDWVVPAGVAWTAARFQIQPVAVTNQTNTLIEVSQLAVFVRSS
jgi:hypothetical protein